MHIEPGIVNDAKIVLSYATATGAAVYTVKLGFGSIRSKGAMSLVLRSMISTALVFCFFQVLPHYPVGISEVHLILGSTLFLLFGAAPAAIGLATGLLLQGVFFTPSDLPQYGMNVTTLLVPLFTLKMLANRIVAPNKAYVDIGYKQALALSTTYQGLVVSWVGFWAIYGGGFGMENLTSVLGFGSAYMLVVLLEPLVDLAVLAAAKTMRDLEKSGLVTHRLFKSA